MGIEFDEMEFAENPEPRCPCVLLLDNSYSMNAEPINELNASLQTFQQALLDDSLASLRTEIALISFGGSVNIVQDFVTPDQFSPPTLSANGDTPMGQAIHGALNLIEQRKQTYKSSGVDYFRPWVFMITDGAPTDQWNDAAQRIQEAENNQKVAFFAVGVQGADMGILGQIAVRQPVLLDGLKFREMFEWLSHSLGSVSRSNPGDDVPLQSPVGWASV